MLSQQTAAQDEGTVSQMERVLSVDVLRGFDMFWIVGGAEIFRALTRLGQNPVSRVLARQLNHPEWEGCTFYDIIFPLFVFLVGMSVVFSLSRIRENAGLGAVYLRIIKRTIVLFLLGLVYNGGIAQGFEHLRLLGVLQRLALCYGFTAILFCHLDAKRLAIVCASLLLGYWALLSFAPVPDIGRTTFSMNENWANYVDRRFLPFLKSDTGWDPEGILSTVPAFASCLLGVFAGLLLKNPALAREKKGYYFMGIGAACLIVGYLWGLQFPIIKKIWTSSYVLVTGGYSYFLLGLFYQIIDVWKVRWWTKPFLWIGCNALFVYVAWKLIDFKGIANRLAGGPIRWHLGAAGEVAVTAVSFGIVLLVARYLYRKKVFIRV